MPIAFIAGDRGETFSRWRHLDIQTFEVLGDDEVATSEAIQRAIAARCTRIAVSPNLPLGKNISDGLATGRCLAVALHAEAIRTAAARKCVDLDECSLAVVGATGEVGRLMAEVFMGLAARVLLVSRPGREGALSPLLAKLAKYRHCIGEVTSDLTRLAECEIVVTASREPVPIIRSEHLSKGNIVICDIAIPHDVDSQVLTECPNAELVRAEAARLDDVTFPMALAEALLLEVGQENAKTGLLGVTQMMNLAREFGCAIA